MENTLTIIDEMKAEITFSDLDNENEVAIKLTANGRIENIIWLSKENIISVRNHLNYLLIHLGCGKFH